MNSLRIDVILNEAMCKNEINVVIDDNAMLKNVISVVEIRT